MSDMMQTCRLHGASRALFLSTLEESQFIHQTHLLSFAVLSEMFSTSTLSVQYSGGALVMARVSGRDSILSDLALPSPTAATPFFPDSAIDFAGGQDVGGGQS